MNYLAFDCATAALSVALWRDEAVFSAHDILPRQHAARLLPTIQKLLAQAELRLSDCDVIAVGVGPGSFIGVRTAVAVAKSLAYAARIPVVAVSSLAILAQTAYADYGVEQVCAGWDARLSALYVGRYQLNAAGVMQVVAADQLVSCAQIDTPAFKLHQGDVGVGNAWGLEDVVTAEFNAVYSDCYPRAECMQPFVLSALAAKTMSSALSLQPNYIRDKVANSSAC